MFEDLSHKLEGVNHKKYQKLNITTKAVLNAAIRRGIEVEYLTRGNWELRSENVVRRIYTSSNSLTDPVGIRIAADKIATYEMLSKIDVPTPKYWKILKNIPEDIYKEFPVVAKPAKATHGGEAVYIDIKTKEKLEAAIDKVSIVCKKKKGNLPLVEQFVEGNDYRALVIDFDKVYLARRMPAFVVGDGKSNVSNLVEEKNNSDMRGVGYKYPLRAIVVDEDVENYLKEQGFTIDYVPQDGKLVYLRKNANISMGGEAFNVTNRVSSRNVETFKRIARWLNLNVVGIDIISPDISVDLEKNKGVVIEANENPGFSSFLFPTKGGSVDPGEDVIDMLFKK